MSSCANGRESCSDYNPRHMQRYERKQRESGSFTDTQLYVTVIYWTENLELVNIETMYCLLTTIIIGYANI